MRPRRVVYASRGEVLAQYKHRKDRQIEVAVQGAGGVVV